MQKPLRDRLNDMPERLFTFLLISFLIVSCKGQEGTASSGENGIPNELIHSSSPYLLQHAYNPVKWFPWGEKALDKAEKDNKLMVISVGYSACHWCHVMEHESFEDSLVAQKMNDHFVSIKVDREERPDIDRIYMNAAYLINQSGGWPLNVITLPDARPIFAGTYFSKGNWMKVLEHFSNLYEKDPEKLQKIAEQFQQGIKSIEEEVFLPQNTQFEAKVLEDSYRNLISTVDLKKGGFNREPKFPMPTTFQYLLRYHYYTGEEKAWQAVKVTLDEISKGGIYDHLGGGFARYSTDAIWKVPHFEKMLYDNSQLVSLFSDAYKFHGDDTYKRVVYETLDFVEREFSDASGGFYSSLDADSEGEEGKFYTWEYEEIEKVLKKDTEVYAAYYSIEKEGNWEEKNILYKTKGANQVAEDFNLTPDALEELIQESNKKLLEIREKRVRPGLDDKMLCAWNALMLKGYVDAYRAFGEEKFLNRALKNAAFIEKNLIKEGYRLDRNFKDGKSAINAFLDDYALLIEAFVNLYQATFDEKWLQISDGLMKYVFDHFANPNGEMFYFASNEDPDLIVRSSEVDDDVIPSSNSSLAKSLFLLGTYLYKEPYIEKSAAMLLAVEDRIKAYPSAAANWAMVYQYHLYGVYEVAIVGEDYLAKRNSFDTRFNPNVFLLGGEKEGSLKLLKNKAITGRTMIYVCQNKSCKLPQTQVEKAWEMIGKPNVK